MKELLLMRCDWPDETDHHELDPVCVVKDTEDNLKELIKRAKRMRCYWWLITRRQEHGPFGLNVIEGRRLDGRHPSQTAWTIKDHQKPVQEQPT